MINDKSEFILSSCAMTRHKPGCVDRYRRLTQVYRRASWCDMIIPMAATAKRTVSLPQDQAAFIDAKVAAGDYASASEVVRAGLRALKERDEAVERWLAEEVATTYDAMAADPERARSADAVADAIRARPDGRLKTGR